MSDKKITQCAIRLYNYGFDNGWLYFHYKAEEAMIVDPIGWEEFVQAVRYITEPLHEGRGRKSKRKSV